MGILIKDMEMPKNCVECRFCDNDGMCVVLGEDLFKYVKLVEGGCWFLPDDWKCNDCPLIDCFVYVA